MTKNKEKNCEGCLSIENDLFPFTSTETGGGRGLFIDQEGCGVEGHQFLKIRYCPACGKVLTSNK